MPMPTAQQAAVLQGILGWSPVHAENAMLRQQLARAQPQGTPAPEVVQAAPIAQPQVATTPPQFVPFTKPPSFLEAYVADRAAQAKAPDRPSPLNDMSQSMFGRRR